MPQYDGPERRARLRIDAGLKAAGWAVLRAERAARADGKRRKVAVRWKQ